MRYTSEELYVGALENVPNCSSTTSELEIWSKFMLMVILQGSQHFEIDGLPFRVDAGHGETRAPLVFMLNVARPSRLRFINDSELPLRKVMISAPQPWLKRLMETRDGTPDPRLSRFFSGHLSHFSFEPGRHILQLAEKIMAPPPGLEGELASLYLKAQALDIMWQSCLALLAEGAEGAHAPALMSLRLCERIRDFVVAHLDRDLTIDLIAAEVGASASTIQRHFKEQSGMTIFDFVRQSRLEAARAALVHDGIQVSRAAHLAGYNNISSFTTAFRKAYGMTPKQVRG